MSPFTQPIAKFIWDNKYRYRYHEQVIDNSIEDTWQRVAKAVAKSEKESQRSYWQQQFNHILSDFSFIPGGRILAGAGTRHKVTLLNCYVMGLIDDSMAGIFTALKEGALTLQQGGGIGYDFSTLRPEGVEVSRSGGIASGPVSFMNIWDSMSAVMQSTGSRRGAMMGTMRCDHPDIERFIEAKKEASILRHFNVSVLVSDEFLRAVHNDEDWALVFPLEHIKSYKGETVNKHWPGYSGKIACQVFKTIRAKTLWEKIKKNAYDCAEPGVIFIDTVNKNNNLSYCEEIYATNPCGEIPLPPYGACNLGAINLTQLVVNPFTEKAKFNWNELENIAVIATRFLDNVLDVTHYPLSAQKKAVQASRRIGLGLTGLANAFVMLGYRYGDEKSQNFSKRVMQVIANACWETSAELASEKECFSVFDKSKYLQGEFVSGLPTDIQTKIKKVGMRNSHHTTIAPTGTTSLLANNISNGLEPIFSANYQRSVRHANGDLTSFSVSDYAYQQWQQNNEKAAYPSAWVDAQELMPEDHLNIQAAVQPYIDNAISKTIFIPEDFPFAKVANIFDRAYQLGLKGCTIFRPNPITGSVLSPPKDDDSTRCCAV